MDSQIKTKAAIEFLQNPKLRLNGLQEKLDFLKQKGLNQNEIDEAINLALIKKDGSGGKWNFFFIVGLFIGGFKLYEYYSQQQNCSNQRPKEEAGTQVDKSEDADNSEPTTVTKSLKDIMDELTRLKSHLEWHRTNTSSELQSIKTLILGHEKFASPPVIPSWQLNPEETVEVEKHEQHDEEQEKLKDDNRTRKEETAKSISTCEGLDRLKSRFTEPTIIGPNPD